MKLQISLTNMFILVLACLTVGLTACGGGGGGGVDGDDNQSGLVEIYSYFIVQDNPNDVYANITGTAFVSPDYVAHKCAGLACVIGWYDDSYPGVDVSWYNQANGSSGYATSKYGTLTYWEHEWHASIPLENGSNLIVINAADPGGIKGTESITIDYLPSVP